MTSPNKGTVSPLHRQTVAKIENISSENDWYPFSYESSQKCKGMFISLSFRGKTLTWKELGEWSEVGPWAYPTDFGECCLVMPHIVFDPLNRRCHISTTPTHTTKNCVSSN